MEGTRNSKKALGLYDKFSDENKSLYDKIIKKSYSNGLDKLTRKELVYLDELYQRKVSEITADENRTITKKDVATIVISLKLKVAITKRNFDVVKYKQESLQLTNLKKYQARAKLNKAFRSLFINI